MHWPDNLVITIYLLISYLRDNELVVDNLVSALLIRWSVTSGGGRGGGKRAGGAPKGLVVMQYERVRK